MSSICALACCPRCGGDSNELLLGYMSIQECATCGHKQLTKPSKHPGRMLTCAACKSHRVTERDVESYDRVPGHTVCEKCEKEIKLFNEIVAEGGIYFRCKACKKQGVIKKCEETELFRKEAKILAPDPVGIELERCDQHGEPADA